MLIKHNNLQVAYHFSFKSSVLFAAVMSKNRGKWTLLELKPGSVAKCTHEFTTCFAARSGGYFFTSFLF